MKNQRRVRQLRPDNPKQTIMRLFSYFKFNKQEFFIGILFIMFGAIAQIGANSMLSPIIDTLIEDHDRGQFIKYLLIMVLFVLIIAMGQYIGNLSMARLAQRTIHKLREEMFSHMEKLPISFFDINSHGELMSTFTNDIDMLNQSLEQSVSQIIISIITVTGTFIMMLYISPLLTGIVVIMLAVMLTSVRFVGKRSAKNFRNQQAQLANMNGYIEEMMSGQKVVKVFNYEDRAIAEFEKKNEDLRKSSTNASTFGVMLMPIMGKVNGFKSIEHTVCSFSWSRENI